MNKLYCARLASEAMHQTGGRNGWREYYGREGWRMGDKGEEERECEIGSGAGREDILLD